MIILLSPSLLKACMPYATLKRVNLFIDPINQTINKYQINTVNRCAAFLAQLAHESRSLKYVKEIASGAAYEGRKDLGNTQPGDGIRFKGRGLIQITGRANYEQVSKAFNVDFVTNPQWLEEPLYAALTAGWYWDTRELNLLADIGTLESFKRITKKINGGYNGLEDRIEHWETCKKALAQIA